MRVAILGGTGPFGRGLARRLAAAGNEVVIGSRDAERAREVASAVGATGARNEAATGGADLVVLAVAAESAVEAARTLRPLLAAAPLLSVGSEVDFGRGLARPFARDRSLAERISEVIDCPVVAGLHSIAARKLEADSTLDEDAFICGNDVEAKQLVAGIAAELVAGRVIDAGPLAAARALEGMTAVLLNVNRRYKTHAGLRVTGLP